MKKDENSDLLRQIIHQKITSFTNEFKGNTLYLYSESISASELGEILGKPTNKIIKFFWEKGKAINLNQSLPSDLLVDFCQSTRINLKRKDKIDFREVIQEYLEKVGNDSQLIERPPIVSIMGHIDHGKTTLLDTIHQTALQKKEAGGITQKVTISQSEFRGKKITFLDTPGHSDFIQMRQRGISLTDLVVLVIDGKDGVMPQTEEIINYLCHYELPVIVFINHKKPAETNNENNLERIKGQCQRFGLTPFEWVSGNAREKTSAQRLLEIILLFAAEFKTNLEDPTHGIVIDAYFHSRTGSRVTELLIQGGKLQEKDTIFLNGKLEKVKILLDIHGGKATATLPGDITKVIGLTSAAELGDRFLVVKDEKAKEVIKKELTGYSEKNDKLPFSSLNQEKKKINLVLISDSQNKLNALSELIKKKTVAETGFSVIYTAIGNLNNSILDLARITQSTILVFGPSPSHGQIKTFKENNIPFFSSKIIYEIEEELDKITGNQQVVEEVEEIVGQAQVVKVFDFSKGNIAGCKLVSGKINRNNRVHVYRGKEEKKVFSGEIKSLESQSEKKSEVIGGQECGIVLRGFDNFQVGDKIVAFHLVKKNVSQN